MRAILNLGFALGAVLVALTSAIHLHLWADGYRTIPVIGPLFLIQGIAGTALAIVVIGWRRLVTALAGIGFMLTTVGGLLISVNFGLFGFMDSLAAPFAGLTLAIEIAGVLELSLVGAIMLAGVAKWRRDRQSEMTIGGNSAPCREQSVPLGGKDLTSRFSSPSSNSSPT